MKSIAIVYVINDKLVALTQTYNLKIAIAEITEPFNKHYGAGNWLCCLASELPADFSVNTYTIKDGLLVPAPAELPYPEEPAAV